MSTHCVITFKDSDDTFHVYRNMDGYPSEILPSMEEAKRFAWDLPRFEAADFAAAYIRAHKGEGGGNLYFTTGPKYHGDLSYSYIVTCSNGTIKVKTKKEIYGT